MAIKSDSCCGVICLVRARLEIAPTATSMISIILDSDSDEKGADSDSVRTVALAIAALGDDEEV